MVPAATLAPAPARSSKSKKNRGFQVRLRNVPPELMAKDLAEAFLAVTSKGRVESVEVIRDTRGDATGEAVVIFSDQADAQNVMHRFHGGDLNGRRLSVVMEGEVDY